MTTNATATVLGATTPGKVAKKRSNAAAPKAASTGEKRDYTKRGTTYHACRVVLHEGKPMGRGRPGKDIKGRMVVYIPIGMKYDAKVHGPGVKFNAASHKAVFKRIRKDSVPYTFDDGVSPAKSKVTAKAKSTKKVAKKTVKKAKSAPVTQAATPAVEIPATAPASTEMVAAGN